MKSLKKVKKNIINNKMKELTKMIAAAALGGLLSVGVWKLTTDESQVKVMPVARDYHAVRTNFPNSDSPGKFDVDFTMAAAEVVPSAVHIKSTMKESGYVQRFELPEPFKDFFGDDFFGQNFQQRGEPVPQIGSGSGVIIKNDGYIVTNNHVINNASDIEVTLNDNRTFKATVVGTDPATDVALLKIDADNLPVIPIGNSDDVKIGEWVLAVGNPFNLESTVTAGIVSAKARNININTEQAAIESFIQTDAAINPGNSGGALVNLRGELVGINTAIATPTGSYAGYGFAVPSNLMKKVVDDLMSYGKVQRAFLGISINNINSKLAEEKDLSVSEGVYVDSLFDDSAAKDAGIKEGDVITRVDQTEIKNVAELQETIARHRPGDEVSITLLRDNKEKVIPVKLKNMSGNTSITKANNNEILRSLGADFETLSKKEKDKIGIDHGVRVGHLYPGKLTQETNIQSGFIITEVDNKKVDSVDDLTAALKNADKGVLLQGIYPQHPDDIFYYGFGL